MVTKREYKELNPKNRKIRRKKAISVQSYFIVCIIIASVYLTWKQQQKTNISWSENYSTTFNSNQNTITQINPKPTEIGSQFITNNYN
ncbi:hypothetical protein STA3757_23550 [Stanieria sp. NIES-3757]|nr:hypothetical protein STA3757_23550 [Stanieria sp. NIES-3757]